MDDALLAELRSHIGDRIGPVYAWDRVNHPMIRQWREAIDIGQSLSQEPLEVPVSMLPVWLMAGLNGQPAPGSNLRDHRAIMKVLEREGFQGILGTNCEQDYERRLLVGERITSTYEVATISDRKQTKFGPGYFITFLQSFYDEADARVGSMRLRILRYRPEILAETAERPPPPQPSISQDTSFFWDGLKLGKLLIQRCTDCDLLRHPPGPACTQCQSFDWDTLESKGLGEIYSFVVVHKPIFPAFESPHPVGLIALDEGVRLVAPLLAAQRGQLAIGKRVQAIFEASDDQHRMPLFHLLAEG
jgi:uncharacterized OB-fold protein